MLYCSRFSSAVVTGATKMSTGATAGVFVLLKLTSQGHYKQSPCVESYVVLHILIINCCVTIQSEAFS
jgi:hypothetical protein